MICRDPTDATGGLTPTEAASYHKGFFSRWDSGLPMNEETVVGFAIDRSVYFEYTGHLRRGQTTTPHSDHWFFGGDLLIGYYAGDHYPVTQKIMADDFHLISYNITKESNKPSESYGQVHGYLTADSTIERWGDKGLLMRIPVSIQVFGSK